MTDEQQEPLDQVHSSQYISQVASCLFLSQNRADITFIVNELCQIMSDPARQSVANLKILFRYFKCRRDTDRFGNHMFQSTHTQATDQWKGQRRLRIVRSSVGASASRGRVSLLCDLGCAMKPVLAIDAKATEHILHRQGSAV